MSTLHQVLGITGPVFAVIAIGFLATAFRIVPEGSSRVLGSFAINFALPAMLFKSISEQTVTDIFQLNYVLAYALGSLLTFGIIFTLVRRGRGLGYTDSAIFSMGASYSNTLMLGFPITLQLLGEAAMIPLAQTLMIENFLMMPLALTIAEAGTSAESNRGKVFIQALKRVFRNPIIIAIFLGMAVSLTHLELPATANKVIDLFAVTVSGVALFAIGGMLNGLQLHRLMADVTLTLAGKLLLHPLIMALAIYLIPGIDPVSSTAAIVLASLPMFGVFPVIGHRYGLGQACAAILVPTTIASFVTLNVAIWLLYR